MKVSSTNDEYTVRKAAKELTVRMCMNHTGGFDFELPNYQQMGGWSRRMPLGSVAAVAAAVPLLFEPGTREKYSNVGIDVGAAVVEKVTGKRWEEFLKERVLDPLGMTETGFWPTEAQLADKIEFYMIAGDRPPQWKACNGSMQTPYGDDRVFASAGAGLWTTARDQLKFYKMLMNLGVGENGARILKEETVKSILAVSTRPSASRLRYQPATATMRGSAMAEPGERTAWSIGAGNNSNYGSSSRAAGRAPGKKSAMQPPTGSSPAI